MYKVMIVDDEYWVVESLRKGIHWGDYGFEVVGWAQDGMEALEKVRAMEPDLIFTDIRMPVMGGLELIQKSRERGDRCEFVVVSGYAEFAYAQKALIYGVLGYCLKPIDDQDVAGVLQKVKLVLNKRSIREVNKSQGAEQELEESDQEDGNLPVVEEMDWDRAKGMRVLVTSSENDFNEWRWSQSPHFGLNRKMIIISQNRYAMAQDVLHEWCKQKDCTVGVSERIYERDSITQGVQQALAAFNQPFISLHAGVFEYQDKGRAILKEILKGIQEGIDYKSITVLQRQFKMLEKAFKEDGYGIKHAIYIYNMITFFLSDNINEDKEELILHHEALTKLFDHIYQMIEFLYVQAVESAGAASEEASDSKGGSIAKEIVQYIDKNFIEDITLQKLADKFYISPNYLCRIIKQRTGKSLTAYISSLRIKYACELLRNTNMQINEISEKCGYENYIYFARVFKRIQNETPTEYRGHNE